MDITVNSPQFNLDKLKIGLAVRVIKNCGVTFALIQHVSPLKLVILFINRQMKTESLMIPIQEIEKYTITIL